MSKIITVKYIGKTTEEFVFGKTYSVLKIKYIREKFRQQTMIDVIKSLYEKEDDTVSNIWHVINEKKDIVKITNANNLFAFLPYFEKTLFCKKNLESIIDKAIIKNVSDILIFSNNSEDIILFCIKNKYVDYSLFFLTSNHNTDDNIIIKNIIDKCKLNEWKKSSPVRCSTTVSLNKNNINAIIQIIPNHSSFRTTIRIIPIHI